ncbi:MAG: J domain-containing protein [Fibrobacterota bacterium]
MNTYNYTMNDALKACRVLFGPDVMVSADFLDYLKYPGLKCAYREGAKKFHPDKATVLGKAPEEMEKDFKCFNQAYEILVPYAKGIKKPGSSPAVKKSGKPGSGDHYYKGRIPVRPLRIGQYLYYKGIISWNTLINSLAWQRINRPPLGITALKDGLLNREQLSLILKNLKPGKFFGETAVEIGFISKTELIKLMAKQRMQGYRLGNYFIAENLLSKSRLSDYLRENFIHNCRNRKTANP